mgnify:CR=1 FL=1
MGKNKFSLRYLPKYEDDLNGIVDYISFKLQNPKSAWISLNQIAKYIILITRDDKKYILQSLRLILVC